MSRTISDLQSSLTESNSNGMLSGSSVLLEVDSHRTHLLNLACFGRSIPTSQSDNQWFQLGLLPLSLPQVFADSHTRRLRKILQGNLEIHVLNDSIFPSDLQSLLPSEDQELGGEARISVRRRLRGLSASPDVCSLRIRRSCGVG